MREPYLIIYMLSVGWSRSTPDGIAKDGSDFRPCYNNGNSCSCISSRCRCSFVYLPVVCIVPVPRLVIQHDPSNRIVGHGLRNPVPV